MEFRPGTSNVAVSIAQRHRTTVKTANIPHVSALGSMHPHQTLIRCYLDPLQEDPLRKDAPQKAHISCLPITFSVFVELPGIAMDCVVCLAVVIAFVSAHCHVLGEHVVRGLKAAYHNLPKIREEDSAKQLGDRVLGEFARIRASNYRMVVTVGLHLTMLHMLNLASRCLEELNMANVIQFTHLLSLYLMDAGVVSGRIQLTGRTMTCINWFVASYFHISWAAGISSSTSTNEHLMTVFLSSTAHMIVGLVFLNARAWIPSAVVLSVTHFVIYVCKFGFAEVSSMLLLHHFSQLFLCCLTLAAAEIGIYTHLKSVLDKEDDRRMMAGFQKILKGLCDGSLLLDSQMVVCGSESCLQRLLSTQKSFQGINFSSLIACSESREKFTALVNTSASSQANDAEASPPSCLRVSLSEAGQIVPVDVFHAVLPGLFGAEEPHHILALVEDTAGREAPPATNGLPEWHPIPQRNPARPWPFSLPSASVSSRGSEAASNASARSNEVLEVLQELAEATFLIDPCSPNADLVEAHLKFNRWHPAQQPPSLRMLSKINEWDNLQRLLQSYAADVLRGATPDLPVALHAMQIRIPGAPRKLLKAKQVRLSLANRSREDGQPLYLYLHLKSFIKKDARPSYITRLQGEALEEQPDDDSSEPRDEGSVEQGEENTADTFEEEVP